MDIHKNARLTLRRREELVQQFTADQTLKRAAARFNVTAKTAAKWVHRYRALGARGLLDRSSRPLRSPRKTSAPLTAQVIALRRQLRPAYQIAQATRLSAATVSRILRRAQLNRWRHLHPAPPIVRYEHAAPASRRTEGGRGGGRRREWRRLLQLSPPSW